MGVVTALDVAAVIALSVYAFHQGVLLLIFFRHKLGARRVLVCEESEPGSEAPGLPCAVPLPAVTVQLPLYNERFVAERVIAAVAALDYPSELLQIQVLDDSTDDTSRIVQRAIRTARAHGANVELIHRSRRDGYKAGALANGMVTATGELIAIFDADFIPPRNFLRRVICGHDGFDDPRMAFVQTRWGHLNADTCAITRAQVIMLDMHFVIDQNARSRSGLKMNFNGSCGIWRRAAIDDAGGWQSDTLTEDLDLSYRAQLRGWRGSYLDDVICPGELPNSVLAFKRQQARWARGSAQCTRKLAAHIGRSSMPFLHKVAALMHVSGYFVNVFVLLLAIITPLLMLGSSSAHMLPGWLSAISVVGVSPFLAMFVAQCKQGRTAQFVSNLPAALLFGIGVSLSNSAAVLLGVFDRTPGEFMRTPKSASSKTAGRSSQRDRRAISRYAYLLQPDWTLWAECVMAVYVSIICLALALRGDWFSVPPLLLYACGFAAVALGQLFPGLWSQARMRTRQRKIHSRLPSMKT